MCNQPFSITWIAAHHPTTRLPLCSWQDGQNALDDFERQVQEACTFVALQALLTRRHDRAAGVCVSCTAALHYGFVMHIAAPHYRGYLCIAIRRWMPHASCLQLPLIVRSANVENRNPGQVTIRPIQVHDHGRISYMPPCPPSSQSTSISIIYQQAVSAHSCIGCSTSSRRSRNLHLKIQHRVCALLRNPAPVSVSYRQLHTNASFDTC